MTTITLTLEQEQAIVRPYMEAHMRLAAEEKKRDDKLRAGIKRKADDRVARANQTAKDWKLRYSETRRSLLAAQAEIITLKRRLRDGDFE